MKSQPTSPQRLLQRLAVAADIGVSPAMDRFCDVFSRELDHFAEFGLQLDPPALIAMTLGPGSRFGKAVGTFLRDELNFDSAVIDEVLCLQQSIDDWMLVRFLTDITGHAELGLYFRRAMSVARAVEWLAARGVSVGERAALAHLGRLMGASKTGVLAARLAAGQPTLYKVYLHAPSSGDQNGCLALAPVFDHFQFPRRLWRPLLEGLDRLNGRGPGDVFVSLTLGDGDMFQALKLDIFQVDLVKLEALLKRCRLLVAHGRSPAAIASKLGLSTAEHCGLALTRDHCTLTSYFVAPTS